MKIKRPFLCRFDKITISLLIQVVLLTKIPLETSGPHYWKTINIG